MHPSARQMIHYGTWGRNDHAKTARKWSDEGERINAWMEDVYLDKIHEKHPEYKRSKLQKMLDHDTFLNAKESVNLGLADAIYDDEEKNKENE